MLGAGNKSGLGCNCDHKGKAALGAAAGLAVGKSTHGSVRASRVCKWVCAWDGCSTRVCGSPGIPVLPAMDPALCHAGCSGLQQWGTSVSTWQETLGLETEEV